MQFHHHGYVSGDPRILEAAGVGLDRPTELPDEVDVLVVGSGPAGMITAAQLAMYPDVNVRIIERRAGRLAVGQADGIQARSVETFQAFGFAGRITEEAFHLTETIFWKPDPDDPTRIARAARTLDDPSGISEFPHLIVNQARVLDHFAEFAANAPGRVVPDYGIEFVGLEVTDGAEYPVAVEVRSTAGERAGTSRTVRARYVVGCDGAASGVRRAIGGRLEGEKANHAWGVMDVLAVTDFPDIRTKCAIQSGSGGSILLIPREGGSLFRMYVDLGVVPADDAGRIRATPLDEIVRRANEILHPYTLDVRHVAWNSVYEVGHRLTDRFDDLGEDEVGERTPRVFLTGDACHTHSAKAGQGMNVSMQDGFNLAWKLGSVVSGRSPERLLRTYSAERRVVAKDLIDFDREWSTLMAAKPEEMADPTELEEFYVRTFEFPAGFMTEYAPSILTATPVHQHLATGFPVGKRFKSARVMRVADANTIHLGHHHRADGRWRIYVFADAPAPGEPSGVTDWAAWFAEAPDSPLAVHSPRDADIDALFDVKVVYRQPYTEVDINRVPELFRPRVGPFGVVDYEKFHTAIEGEDVFEARGISPTGAVVVVRPDQYVSNVLPLDAREELADYFAPLLTAG
ncbi:3-hydroxybenzoate 4-monooxygenase [Pseudoclavibacter chungangensis]|uniref:3-hydroxybenzoate 4-monooxygenase n=1 Tax=Pseudoclavibacter chungangensis TaxID=587635 RepID=A0A7J5BZX8_9MICO|nr:FAD-binding monooxygenase [Pseudoclavibacter chungangensis]KAB1660205.1 3-hydroxybenzoate 4-monooxygenase [Pseudoclavibacter chungangensis]